MPPLKHPLTVTGPKPGKPVRAVVKDAEEAGETTKKKNTKMKKVLARQTKRKIKNENQDIKIRSLPSKP